MWNCNPLAFRLFIGGSFARPSSLLVAFHTKCELQIGALIHFQVDVLRRWQSTYWWCITHGCEYYALKRQSLRLSTGGASNTDI
jgi:hypothetical protein